MNQTMTRTAIGIALLAAVAMGVLLAVNVANAASATLTATPSAVTLNPGGQVFTVDITQNADVTITGTQTDLNFDETRLEILDYEYGPAYSGATKLVGVAPNNTKPAAIADANANGTLENLAAYFSPGSGDVPAGTAMFATITLRTRNSGGNSPIDLAQVQVIDSGGTNVPASGQDSQVSITGPISVGGVVETITGGGDSGNGSLWLLGGLTAVIGLAALGAGRRLAARRSA